MKKLVVLLILSGNLVAQSKTEQEVLQTIQRVARERGRINFSDLYNDPRFTGDQKKFLGRLYEVFFAIPKFLATEFKDTGEVPTRGEIAAGFGVSEPAIELLLKVMEADRRVPALYTRDPETKELKSLNLANINAFLKARGDDVRLTNWEGEPVPAFSLKSFSGESISASDLNGNKTLLYFWFTGCPPCVRIAPIISALYRQYREQGFQVIGLNADEELSIGTTLESRIAYLKKHDIPYVNADVDSATRKAFGSINVFPTLFFVDSNGTITRHFVNFQDRETLEEVIQKLLN